MKGSNVVKTPMACAAVSLLIAGLSVGCASSHVEKSSTYSAPGAKHFNKILVIGVAKRPENRRLYEDAFVRQLQADGTVGVASYPLLPDAQMTDRAAIDQAVAPSRADAVLVTHVLKVTKQDVTVPPSMELQNYMQGAMPGSYEPTVLGQTDIATLKAALFDAASRHVVWSSTVQVDAGNLPQAIMSASKTIVKELVKQKLLGPR